MAYAYDMIQETITSIGRRCGGPDIVKNGTNKCGSPPYYCQACGAHRTLVLKRARAAQFKALILKTYLERASLHGLERIFPVSRQTVAHWLRPILRIVPAFKQTVFPAQPGDVLERDEVWSFVLKKGQKRWLGIALCRRTRHVVAVTIGDRSAKTGRRRWNKLPTDYQPCQSDSDFWDAYQKVGPTATHHAVGKDTGETAHIERWNNT